ncbi:MAG: phenylalanine--tRNA ligase subunit alpha, partial [Acidobacteria bacterium]|nr:phenylalanine--tRNA ligase subunit alpha [Acidobacteriota bacterium]
MEDRVQEVRRQFDRDLASARDAAAVDEIRVRYVGRRAGILTALLKDLRDVPGSQRSTAGKAVNDLKIHVEAALEAAAARHKGRRRAPAAAIDLSLPGRAQRPGTPHPITQVRDLIEEIFLEMGYSLESGPEVESDYYNFEALNIPPHHPARDMQDTFYVEGGFLLRTHTSPVQIRAMEKRRPPLK